MLRRKIQEENDRALAELDGHFVCSLSAGTSVFVLAPRCTHFLALLYVVIFQNVALDQICHVLRWERLNHQGPLYGPVSLRHPLVSAYFAVLDHVEFGDEVCTIIAFQMDAAMIFHTGLPT